MELLIAEYVDYAVDVLSMSAADGRKWAVAYVWDIAAMRTMFNKLELELFAATCS
jgi:hypothetical protein